MKLALVLAASKREQLLILQEDLEEASAILHDAELSMIKVFESVGVVDEAKHLAEIMQFIRAYKFLSSQDLYRLCHNIMSEKDFKQALRLAIEGDLVDVRIDKDGKRGVAPERNDSLADGPHIDRTFGEHPPNVLGNPSVALLSREFLLAEVPIRSPVRLSELFMCRE